VGKDAGCSYVIKDSQLSKSEYNLLPNKQFKISRKKDAIYLEDVGGTFVNKKKVGPGGKTVLNHNDCIAIVKSHLKGRHCYHLYSSQSSFSHNLT
jgi:pSer/pThr/pTyr-binding forkhead associated (FHA) protein